MADDFIFACFHTTHVDVRLTSSDHAVLARATSHVRGIGAGNHRFRRRAAVVHARATEEVTLDDRHVHPIAGEPSCQRGPCLARAAEKLGVTLKLVTAG